MNRDEIRDKFSPLLDGELSPEERAEVEQALSEDADLLRELDGLKRVDDLYRALPRAAAPDGFEEGVKEKLRSKVRTFSGAPRRLRRLAPALAAAVVLVSAVTLVWFQTQSGRLGAFDVASQRSLKQALEAPETRAAGQRLEAPKSSPPAGLVAGTEATESSRSDGTRLEAMAGAPASGVEYSAKATADAMAPAEAGLESVGAIAPQRESVDMQFDDFDFSNQVASASTRRDGASEPSVSDTAPGRATGERMEAGAGAGPAIPRREAGISDAAQTAMPERKLAELFASEPDRLYARTPAASPPPLMPSAAPIETAPTGLERAAKPLDLSKDSGSTITGQQTRAEVGVVMQEEEEEHRNMHVGRAPQPAPAASKTQVAAAFRDESAPSTLTPEESALDSAVISAALEDFIRAEDVWPAGKKEGKSVLLVDAISEGAGGFLSEGQIEADLMHADWRLSDELLESLRTRNSTKVTLRSLALGTAARIVDLRTPFDSVIRPERWTRVEQTYPDALAAVYLWLPGYSEDKSQAVVRFHFDPTSHGATATYLVVKEGDSWKVKERKLAYYA
jgi:hypothetical protein